MFGIGIPEMGVILLVATLVFGPDRMPDLARQLARVLRQLRQLADNARTDLRAELGPGFAELDLSEMDPRTVLRNQLADILEEHEIADPQDRKP